MVTTRQPNALSFFGYHTALDGRHGVARMAGSALRRQFRKHEAHPCGEDSEIRAEAMAAARIQEGHIPIIRCLCDLVDPLLFGEERI